MGKGKATRELNHEARMARYQLWKEIIRGLKWVCILGISAVPLWVLVDGFKAAAGKETKINLGLSLTVAGGGIAAIAKILLDRHKLKEQTRELIRLRQRCTDLEQQLNAKPSSVKPGEKA
jgi:hypothetical protein